MSGSLLWCVAVFCCVLQCVAMYRGELQHVAVCCSVLQRGVVQYSAMCCSDGIVRSVACLGGGNR